MKRYVFAITLAALLASVANTATADEFTDNPGAPALKDTPRKPDVSKGKAQKYRTRIIEVAAKGPNFNGHMRIAYWGCGSNCIEWAIINLVKGSTWFAPAESVSCGGLSEPVNAKIPDWFEARVESRLFFIHECSSSGSGTRVFDVRKVYVWQDGGAKLLRSEPLTY
ncbi:MAG: hypothetical protein LH481_12155 [Burkholderiales bacterium]|nr:hypothetical protein [Burkholderiales bacterium]